MKIARAPQCVLLMLSATVACADWDPNGPFNMHFPQLPDPNGLDINIDYPIILADDWQAAATGPVSAIHFWFSMRHGTPLLIDPVYIAIYADVPAGAGQPFSHPGTLLWDHTVDAPAWRHYGTGHEGWYDPSIGEYFSNDHTDFFQFNLTDLPAPWIQQFGQVYWLGLSVLYQDPAFVIGWKTADLAAYPPPHQGQPFLARAVWGLQPVPAWQPLAPPGIPPAGLDLAFVIVTQPPLLRGDCNCDQRIDFGDINYFVAALQGESEWSAYYAAQQSGQPPPCLFANCDINGDGAVDFGDIDPFVALLVSGP